MPRLSSSAATGDQSQVDKTRQKAGEFVGTSFFGLLLKELRKSTNKSKLIHGGAGENIMQPYFDQVIVERLAQSSEFDLSRSITDRLFRDRPFSTTVSPEMAVARSAAARKEQP